MIFQHVLKIMKQNKHVYKSCCSFHIVFIHTVTVIMSIPFEIPTTVLLAGPTQSGKSYWIRDLIKHGDEMFKETPEKVVYCYTAWQTMFEAMKEKVHFHRGLPSQVNLEEWSNGHMLLILDDLMQEVCSSKEVMSLFTIHCHHKNISVLFLSQNIFPPGKCARTIFLNCHYIVLFGTKRDELQVQILGRQIFPGQKGYFMSAYQDATKQPYGYLVYDLHLATDSRFQLRSRVFRNEVTWFYSLREDD